MVDKAIQLMGWGLVTSTDLRTGTIGTEVVQHRPPSDLELR